MSFGSTETCDTRQAHRAKCVGQQGQMVVWGQNYSQPAPVVVNKHTFLTVHEVLHTHLHQYSINVFGYVFIALHSNSDGFS